MSRITLGITVNLGNYENIRIEVERNIHSMSDYIHLHRELTGVLDDFADQTDGPTRDAFIRYRNRVAIDPRAVSRDVR